MFDNIELQNKERPTESAIKKWEEKIEFLLSPHNIKAKLVIKEHPTEFWSVFRNPEGETKQHYMIWVDGVIVSNNEIDELFIPLYGTDYVSEETSHYEIWNNAFEIQNYIYKFLEKSIDTQNRDDIYWLLWDKRIEN